MKIFVFLCLMFAGTVLGQNTLGVTKISSNSTGSMTLFSPFTGTKSYLIDECGRLTNVWDRGTLPGLSAYLLPNGNLFRTYQVNPLGPFTSASNAGGLELVDWENRTLWHFEINKTDQLSHHDAVFLPNGNLLVLTWTLVFKDELIALGRDPTRISEEGYMWSENILEIKPHFPDSAEVVWEWNIKDHYIQDFDPRKKNFGNVADHPELFDINLPELGSNNSNASRDWNHFNSIDYHSTLDQILVSTRNSDEIWILDHSTSTSEAASHLGGNAGKGGDILYRWGNASAYGLASADDQKLFGQHGAQWITEGLEGSGGIIIFNNGNGRVGPDYSTIEILYPPLDSFNYHRQLGAPFGPAEAVVVYGENIKEVFSSPFLSNAQRLARGHTFINSGTEGRLFEIDRKGSIVWEYIVPLWGDTPLIQGSEPHNNWVFRAYRYEADFFLTPPDLLPADPIELNPDLSACLLITSDQAGHSGKYPWKLQKIDTNTFQIKVGEGGRWRLSLFDLIGRKLREKTFREFVEFHLSETGVFFLAIEDPMQRIFSIKIFH